MRLAHRDKIVATVFGRPQDNICLGQRRLCPVNYLQADVRRIRANENRALEISLVGPLKSSLQARAQVCPLLGEAVHSMGAWRNERVYKSGKIPPRRRIRPVKLAFSISEALGKVGEKSLVESGSLVMTNAAGKTCFGLPYFRVARYDDKCGIRHAFHP